MKKQKIRMGKRELIFFCIAMVIILIFGSNKKPEYFKYLSETKKVHGIGAKISEAGKFMQKKPEIKPIATKEEVKKN